MLDPSKDGSQTWEKLQFKVCLLRFLRLQAVHIAKKILKSLTNESYHPLYSSDDTQNETDQRFDLLATHQTDLPDVITVHTGDQHLALVIIDEKSSNHGAALTQCSQVMLENCRRRTRTSC